MVKLRRTKPQVLLLWICFAVFATTYQVPRSPPRTSYQGLLRNVGSFCGESKFQAAGKNQRNAAAAANSSSTLAGSTNHQGSYQYYQEGESGIPLPPKPSIPTVPSLLFRKLAESQLELLANSIVNSTNNNLTTPSTKKIRLAALYLPAENAITGQLEFTPAILFPNPKDERVFIANDSDSGVAPSLPRRLTRLPGFSHASVLIPRYPMVSVSETEPCIGVVEEVFCDLAAGGTALSVPLFSGSQTVGVLFVSPASDTVWTMHDRQQVAKAAQSISLALSMETERALLAEKHQRIQYALSESLHQVKNPLQALRTYGKLLQQRMASESSPSRLLELAEHLVLQSDRLVDRLKPVDELVASLSVPLALLKPAETKALVPWRPTLSVHEDALESQVVNMKEGELETPPTNFLGEMELEMSFVQDVLEPVLSSFAGIAETAGIEFNVVAIDDLPGVIIWVEALQEAVINLLDNAVKYNTNPSPQIRVRLLPHANGVTILVEDNGPGITVQEALVVFERGYRGNRGVSNGSGIGLTIARSLVEQMGGSLRWVSEGTYSNSLGGTTMELKVFRKRTNQQFSP